MTKNEALRLALDALKELKAVMPIFPKDGECIVGYKDRYNAAQYQASQSITVIKAALEQPEPEPVAWTDIDFTNIYISEMVAREKSADVPLYTSPPKREWQGLTDDEIDELQSGLSASHTDVQAIEAKLKEKNT